MFASICYKGGGPGASPLRECLTASPEDSTQSYYRRKTARLGFQIRRLLFPRFWKHHCSKLVPQKRRRRPRRAFSRRRVQKTLDEEEPQLRKVFRRGAPEAPKPESRRSRKVATPPHESRRVKQPPGAASGETRSKWKYPHSHSRPPQSPEERSLEGEVQGGWVGMIPIQLGKDTRKRAREVPLSLAKKKSMRKTWKISCRS